MLPLPTHSCYPVSNYLKLFPLSGLLLLVLEIIPNISILSDSWPLPELTSLTVFLQEQALPQDPPSLMLPRSCDTAAPAHSLHFAALPPSFSRSHCTPFSSCIVSSERLITSLPNRVIWINVGWRAFRGAAPATKPKDAILQQSPPELKYSAQEGQDTTARNDWLTSIQKQAQMSLSSKMEELSGGG